MTLAPDLSGTPEAVRTDLCAIFVLLELSRATWLVTSLSPGGGEKMSRHPVRGGDVAGLLGRFADLQARALARTGTRVPLVVIQEAAWTASGFTARLSRMASRAMSWMPPRSPPRGGGGAPGQTASMARRWCARSWPVSAVSRVCAAMVRVPTPDEEGRRRLHREFKALISERVRHARRICGVSTAERFQASRAE